MTTTEAVREIVVPVERVLAVEDAASLIGTHVEADLAPTVRSPRDGSYVRVTCEGETVALITRLPADQRHRLRHLVTGVKYGQNIARQGRGMGIRGVTFGYNPPKVAAMQEGCRMGAFGRDNPEGQALLEEIAAGLSDEFLRLLPEQAAHDRATVTGSVLTDWRMGESLWTSGVINDANVLPYHRDGNNLETWSAMPTIRFGMNGGLLHLPEFALVLPCGDGDVTWFYGRGIVHGVTPMGRRDPKGYRYSLVFYALKGLVNCTTYAAETAKAAAKRSERERAEAARIRAAALTTVSTEPVDQAALDDLTEFARIETSVGDVEPWAEIIGRLHRSGHLDAEAAAWMVALYNSYDDLGSAWSVFRRWPSPQAWWSANDGAEAASYPCTQERRNLRGGRVLKRHASYVEQLAGMMQNTWLRVPLMGESESDFARLTEHLRSVWGVGRQSAFEWAEFAAKSLGLPVTAADAQLWESEGPRRSLQKLYGNPNPSAAWLDERAAECRAMLAERGVPLTWEDFETIICDFNVMRDGRYYPGRHLAALREEIDIMPEPDRSLWLDQFEQMTPWAKIAPGIDPDLLPVYRDTGKIATPEVPL